MIIYVHMLSLLNYKQKSSQLVSHGILVGWGAEVDFPQALKAVLEAEEVWSCLAGKSPQLDSALNPYPLQLLFFWVQLV